jgi:cytochrome P450
MNPNLCNLCETMFKRIKKSSQIHVPLTILFADVRGYTSVSELLDTPEVIRLLSFFYEECGEAVWERDGIVNKLIGDAILAIFNFPIERHDHVKNAVLSAIALQERWATRRSVGEGDSQMPIGVGVGIHTGTVAVGDVGEACRDFTAVGSVVNLASRLQGAARPGEVLVTESHKFVKGRGLQLAKRLLGEGLLTSEGEFHKRQRRLAQPAFHRQRIASYGRTMVEYAARTGGRWRDGTVLDIAAEMSRLTLVIVGKTLFDADVDSEAGEIGEALTESIRVWRLSTIPFGELLEKLPLPSTRRFQAARARLDATIYRFIEEHRSAGIDRGDLLSMLLLSMDAEGDGGSMTDGQLRDEAMTIFLAGHETTANALAWTWYLLSQNPEAEAHVHAELGAVLSGKSPSVEDLPKLTYTEMVLAESMRLYPPAWIIGRKALEDVEVNSYLIPAGSLVLMSQYVMHRDPRYYPDPNRFEPLRWSAEAKAARPKFSYFPFGGGPRVCLGESFAWMEGVLVIATLAQRWRMQLVPGHPVEPQPLITLRPKFGMRMFLQRRS